MLLANFVIMIATSVNRPKLKLTIISLLITLIFNVSCKKENNEQPAPEVPQEKWTFISYFLLNQKGHFHEDRNGIISYRNKSHVYIFDASGKLIKQFEEYIQKSVNPLFPFMKNGSFYLFDMAGNYYWTDYVIQYERTGISDFSKAKIIDIRKTDTLYGNTTRYEVLDVAPDNLKRV